MFRAAFAIGIQLIVLGVFYYADAWATVQPSWRAVLRAGINPYFVVWAAFAHFPLWWSYRQVYAACGGRFWYALMIQGLILSVYCLILSAVGSRTLPNRFEVYGLVIGLVGVIVAGLGK